jgi:glycosyltransferase involved in cell wall biosynthesis
MQISVCTPTISTRKGLDMVAESLSKQTFRDFEWLVEVNVSGKPDLNAAYNRMLKRAKGDIIVSVQDNIALEPQALEKIASARQGFWTYQLTNVADWRKGEMRKMSEYDWEIDFGSAPRQALFDIGGFDETLDEGRWGFDNVNVGFRAFLAGHEIWVDPSIMATGVDHERDSFRDLRDPTYHNWRLQQFRMGERINYLV